MTKTEQIYALDLNIDTAKKNIETNAALQRLLSNKDFRSVIKEGYFEREAVRLVHLKGAPHMQTQEQQASIIKQMDSIAALHSYFQVIQHTAMSSLRSMEADEETRAELMAEEIQA